jgi:CHAT domain-containing protein
MLREQNEETGMASADNNSITFVIPGQRQGASRGERSATALPGQLKDSVRVGARRGTTDTVRVTAVPGVDVVVLHIAGGPVLLLHPHNARDLMLGQGSAQRSAGAAAPGEVSVPAQLRWRGLEQAAPTRSGGFLGTVLLQAFEVITGLGRDKAASFAASQVVQRLDGQVDAGVYALRPDALAALKGSGSKLGAVPAAAEPMLVFIHGTFVDTASTFAKLWALHPQRVRELFAHYGGRVYALDHPTLGASPIANALTLVRALPQGARLHLATHSRGGLVAEVLARVAGQRSLTKADFAFFAGAEYAGQRKELQDLADEVTRRDVRVDRVLRVACPARGTLLASKRLDAYVSVLKWAIELTGVPVLPSLLDFVAEVAQRRADPAQLPGLAAMIPDSPLCSWLNAAEEPIAGDLRVVAGDLQGDSVGSWIKTLLADAYYWTDNDVVVQTRSMYGGTPRSGGASFLLDQGGKVTHFNYFVNARTVEAVVGGLTQAKPAGFRSIGPLSWAGQDAGGVRAAGRGADDGQAASDKPAVFVLPGILGSNLRAGDKRIWLSLRLIGGLSRLKYDGNPDNVLPDGPIGMVYGDLAEHLAQTHEVIEFAFDWRRPIEEEAHRLADAVETALDARNANSQPVRLIAHSMGGLVARTMQLERPKTWERLMQREGARLLMLGTPNGGSWAPMQVLSGDDTFGNALAAFGSPLRDKQARQLMAEMPGFIQLQASLLDDAQGLAQEATWKKIAQDDLKRVQENNWWHHSAGEAPDAAYEWGIPPQKVLDQAKALRLRLDAQRDAALKTYATKMLLVVGRAKFTPDGFEWGNDGFVYLDATDGGDGRVPLQSALLPGVRTWSLDCEHGSLPDAQEAFGAFVELLQIGDTARLERLRTPALRSGLVRVPNVAHVRSRPSRARPSALPAESQRAVFAGGRGIQAEPPDSATVAALNVTVLNGNLSFVRQPLLVGHYRALALTGTERVVNSLIGGAMKASIESGLYPDAPGSHQVFVNARRDPGNPWQAPRPRSAVVVGLGEEGKLSDKDLALSVRQGVIAWAQRVAEGPEGAPATMEMAATLMGSGGVGVTASSAARAIAQGVQDANERLARSGWPVVSRLFLVELYLERASDAWHGLQVLATAAPGRFKTAPTIASGIGPLRRQIDSGYRGTDYDLITALSPVQDTIAFTLDTKRARTEVRAQTAQGKLLRQLVERASTDSNQDPRLGRTLFQLLVPPEMEAFFGGTSHMLLELDGSTAPIPWELLDTQREQGGAADPRPWAIRCQLLRKLRMEKYRTQVQDASADDAVLVVGEPLCDEKTYARLPGALAEAQAIVAQLTGPGGLGAERVNALVERDDAASVINALFERRYRIVHIAGHGEPVERNAAGLLLRKGGVVLSDDTFLGADEINSMRTVPELVFVNCCHLAARVPGQTLRGIDRAAFAAGVADALIEIGVRCVVAAGWAVDDGPASTFATTFYRLLLAGQPFISAVAAAREAAWNDDKSSNTWAAYQCYGDPNWVYRRAGGDAQVAATLPRDEYEGVASPLGLAIALEELAVKSKYMHADATVSQEKARHLEARFGALWGGMGAVAEAFALAYAEAGERTTAIAWYERALQCNDASASMKAHEQLGNLRARHAWAQVAQAAAGSPKLKDARAQIITALHGLQALADLQPTLERHSLCGSAWKLLAMLEQRAGDGRAQQAALAKAMAAYRSAEALAAATQDANLFYPALNRLALEVVSNMGAARWAGFNATATAAARASLQGKAATDPDFWSLAGLSEIDMLAAVAQRRLAEETPALLAAYADLHSRVAAPSHWGSVADQADFVLTPYTATVSGNEREAAAALLAVLRGYAL